MWLISYISDTSSENHPNQLSSILVNIIWHSFNFFRFSSDFLQRFFFSKVHHKQQFLVYSTRATTISSFIISSEFLQKFFYLIVCDLIIDCLWYILFYSHTPGIFVQHLGHTQGSSQSVLALNPALTINFSQQLGQYVSSYQGKFTLPT